MYRAHKISIHYLLLFLGIFPILFPGCSKKDTKKELFEVEYIYDFDLPGGLLTNKTHVFQFLNKPTDINGVIDERVLENVNSVNVITAELINLEHDGGLDIIREMESFIYPNNTTDIYYDVAYTVELPRKERNYIQLFSSGDELKSLFQYQLMDVELRIRLWQIPQRSRHLQYRIRLGFYN